MGSVRENASRGAWDTEYDSEGSKIEKLLDPVFILILLFLPIHFTLQMLLELLLHMFRSIVLPTHKYRLLLTRYIFLCLFYTVMSVIIFFFYNDIKANC